MVDMKSNRSKEINDMVSIVKLASLLFTAIIIFQYLLKKTQGLTSLIYQQIIILAVVGIVLFLLAIYLLWALSLQEKMNKNKYTICIVQIIEE